MDPLSITASVITVLQAANSLISMCYDFRSALKEKPWSLTRIIDEVKDLRNVLEALERLVDGLESKTSLDLRAMPSFKLLCEPKEGPLATCLRELTDLEQKLSPSSWIKRPDSKRAALMKAVGWQFKDRDAIACMERIERCKNTLSLAIAADEAALLLNIQNTTTSMNSTMRDMGDKFTGFLVETHRKQLDERHKDLMQWLSPVDCSEIHSAACEAHQEGTSNWFIESEAFTDWRRTEGSFLWLSGFPGAGKTMLFSNAVGVLERDLGDTYCGSRMAYFYCDFRRQHFQDPITLIASLAAQLCYQFGWCPTDLELACNQSNNYPGQRKRPSFKNLAKTLQEYARDSKIFLLIDALDECSSRDEVLHFLMDLTKSKQNINVLVTGRDEPNIREELTSVTRLEIETRLHDVESDIQRYIDHRLQSDRKLHWLSASVKSEIGYALRTDSGGMFRWVQCQLDAISSLRTIKAVRAALEQLPQGLNETYENILEKVPETDVLVVRRVLLWLAFSVLPLTLQEMHEAVAIEEGQDYIDEESRLTNPEEVLNLCSSLLTVSDGGYIRLAHLSVKDYLLSSQIGKSRTVSVFAMTPNDANHELAMKCLTYLFFNDLTTGPSTSSKQYLNRLTRHPLLKHAATAWTYYVRASNPTTELKILISKFFSLQSRQSFMAWVQVLNAYNDSSWDVYPRHATALYYAASFGLSATVEDLISNGVNLNAPGSRFGGTALHAAVLRQHIPVMRLLLEAGADPSQADYNLSTPLHTAVSLGNTEVIAMLLEFGASTDAVDDEGETPHDWAVRAAQSEAQSMLLGLPTQSGTRDKASLPQDVWTRCETNFPHLHSRHSDASHL